MNDDRAAVRTEDVRAMGFPEACSSQAASPAMSLEQHLLGKIAEEASEIVKVAMKAQQFGLRDVNPTQQVSNLQQLIDETNDLLGCLQALEANGVPLAGIGEKAAMDAKESKICQWLKYSIAQGRVRLTPAEHSRITAFLGVSQPTPKSEVAYES